MLGRVFVLRRVAATDVAADQAQPQVNPGIARLQAVLATVRARLDLANLIDMQTLRRHPVLLSISFTE
jgi:hypothetical protein